MEAVVRRGHEDGEPVTPYDALLLWASEREMGSMAVLNAAADWTAYRIGRDCSARDRIDDLQVLGHLTCEGRTWRVTPPTWTRLADGGGNGLLFGARPRWLLAHLKDLDSSTEPAISKLADFVGENRRVPQAGPATWYFSTGPGNEIEALDALGVRTRDDIAGGLLARLENDGAPGQERTVRPGELLARLVDDSQFSDGGPEWAPISGDLRTGVYRYLRNNQIIVAEKTGDGRWIERDLRWALWLARDPGRKRLIYSPSQRSLTVRDGIRLPMEIERALVMRSGRLPKRISVSAQTGRTQATAHYENVNLAFAEGVAKALNREVEMN